ncbi:MAG: hypothetical protein H6810_01630 [Phycisphaeraceae bacterium]|nr:MAG: hypothetical protein H6810_01630 [Phycisphaeraceae bacterium]
MASRTSAGTAVVVTITIFGILWFVATIAAVYFFSEMDNAKGQVRNLQTGYEEIVKAGERESENVRAALGAARSDRKSLVDYLMTTNRELMKVAAGNPDLTLEQLRARATELTGSETEPLTQAMARLQGLVKSRDAELASARERMDRLQADTDAERQRIRTVEAGVTQAVDEANSRVGSYGRDVADLRTQVEGFENRVQREMEDERSRYQGEIRDKDRLNADLNQQILVLQDQVRRLRGEGGTNRVTPLDEFALVDGEVAAVEPAGDAVVITLGRKDKLVIGMAFSVYGSASEIHMLDGTDNYRPGKAVIEVIGIDESSARCRVVKASRGNPVIVGDVIANPVYDPKKTYNFVVFGNFDVNGDGIATPFERDALVAIIERWGGKVIDDIAGDLDFLVLGRRPVEPVQPAPNAPREVYDEYLRLKGRVDRYEALFAEASASSIPVLNENRLRTLIGEFPR